jgi:dihydrofolate reductase
MRKIIVGAQVSMDGVMQAPGGPTEDPTKGFNFGGWAMPYFGQEFGEEINRVFNEKFDLLLGRKTYEIFAGYWPYYRKTARTSSPRAVRSSSTRCSPMTWSTPSASSQCRSCLAAARGCSPTARPPMRSS